jgi:hypothetical protein
VEAGNYKCQIIIKQKFNNTSKMQWEVDTRSFKCNKVNCTHIKENFYNDHYVAAFNFQLYLKGLH